MSDTELLGKIMELGGKEIHDQVYQRIRGVTAPVMVPGNPVCTLCRISYILSSESEPLKPVNWSAADMTKILWFHPEGPCLNSNTVWRVTIPTIFEEIIP